MALSGLFEQARLTSTFGGKVDAPAMAQLLKPSFAIIPLFLVPIVIASHIWIFERLLRRVGVGR